MCRLAISAEKARLLNKTKPNKNNGPLTCPLPLPIIKEIATAGENDTIKIGFTPVPLDISHTLIPAAFSVLST